MKKILKILAWLILSLILLVIIILVSIKLGENKIAGIALEQVSAAFKAPIKAKSVSLVWLRKFPYATIQLDDVMLGSEIDSLNTQLPDTILFIERVYLSLKTKALLNNEIDVVKIELSHLNFNYKVDKQGKSNLDFLMDTTSAADTSVVIDSTSTPLNLSVRKLDLNDITITYTNNSTMTNARVHIPAIELKAKIKENEYTGELKGDLELDNCALEGTNLYLMKRTELAFNVFYNDGFLRIDKFELETDGAKLKATGEAQIGDTIDTDISLEGSDILLGELMKYAPTQMLKEFGLRKVGGELNVKAHVKGIYTENQLPRVDATISMTGGQVLTVDYPALKNIAFTGNVTNGELQNNKTTRANFDKFYFETPKSKFNLAFSVSDIDHPNYKVNTQMDINIDDFVSFIPDSTLKSINGLVRLEFFTQGQLPDSIGDDFTDYVLANSRADIDLRNFNVQLDDTLSVNDLSVQMAYRPNNFALKNLNVKVPAYLVDLKNTSFDIGFKGSLNNTRSLDIDLRSYNIEMGSNVIKGKARVKNLEHPTYSIKTNIALNLGELKAFVPNSLVNILSGDIIADIESAGTINLDSVSVQAIPLVFEQSAFRILMKDINVEMPDTLYKVHHFSGQIAMESDTININKMEGNISGFDFAMDSTQIWNVYKAYMQKQAGVNLIVQTNISLGTIDYAMVNAFLIAQAKADSLSSINNTEELKSDLQNDDLAMADTIISDSVGILPDLVAMGLPHFLIRGKLTVEKVIYEKNIIDDISLLFRFADSLYVVDQFKLSTCGGNVETSLKFDARRNYYEPVVDIKNTIEDLDVRKLLRVNDNFGDTVLTYEKVTGILTSDLNVRVFLIGDSIPTDKIRVKGNFMLEDGRLYNYQPLVDVSEGLKMLGGLDELDKLDFNTLKTSVFMLRNKIYLPKTDVITSSLDFSAFAMHNIVDQSDYEYHLVLHLGDVLKGKSDRLMKAQAKQNKKDGGVVERNGLNLISMQHGTDKKNGFDNDKIKKKFDNSLNKQRGFLNLFFNPDLVNFSTDMDRNARNRQMLKEYGEETE